MTRAFLNAARIPSTKSCTTAPAGGAGTSRRPHRRLEAAEERLVAALRVEVVADHEERLAVEGELGGERLAARESGGVRRGDAARADGSRALLLSPVTAFAVVDVAARTVDEREAAVGAEEEADADVAARLAAVLVVDRVDLAELVGRPAGRLDRGDQQLVRQRGVGDVDVVDVGPRCCPGSPASRRCPARGGCRRSASASPANFAGGSRGRGSRR